jgi:carbon dioxide concentrating mechanism protein CcmL
MSMSRENGFERAGICARRGAGRLARVFFSVKLGTVIGRVTLNRSVESLRGGRFLVVSPFSREQYAAGLAAPAGMGKDPSLVVYDNLGADVRQVIGYEEGREAAQPFDQPTPVDAINAALVDEIFYRPFQK